jgi:hypothetical protein
VIRRFSPGPQPASEAAAGSRVTAQCALSVVADYEWDAFDLPICGPTGICAG